MQEPICPVGIFHLVNLLYYWRSIKRAGSLLGRETDRPLFLIDRRRYRTSPKKKSEEQNNFISILRICFQFVEQGWLCSIWTTINGRTSKSWSSFLRPCWTKHNSLRFPICWFLPQNPFVRFLIPKTWSLIFPVHIFLFSISTFVPLGCLCHL